MSDAQLSSNSGSSSGQMVNLSSISSSASRAGAQDTKNTTAQVIKTRHLGLIKRGAQAKDIQKVNGIPVFTQKVLDYSPQAFTQYGLLAGDSEILDLCSEEELLMPENDPRLYVNVAAPSGTFICGSQGSGKSHTLSCLLENFLLKFEGSELENPLAAMVFHYDTFSSDEGGTPCETAYIGLESDVRVKVYCAPTSLATIEVRKLKNVIDDML